MSSGVFVYAPSVPEEFLIKYIFRQLSDSSGLFRHTLVILKFYAAFMGGGLVIGGKLPITRHVRFFQAVSSAP
jgi:hypothetical protein